MERGNIAIGLSGLAVLLAVYAALRSPAAPPSSPSASAAPLTSSATAAPRSDLTNLERRLAALETRSGQLERIIAELSRGQPSPSPAAGASVVAASSANPNQMPDGAPRFARFDAGGSNIEVKQEESGALAVTNRDPTLTGKVLIVRAYDADGHETTVTVVVPPPSK
ncbi:MAG: hypothetical protein U0271_21080 [Polyangiaceae bacterium]